MFRAGVAYPIRAQMLGSGVGVERHCVFSTGAFVEPLEVRDEPRLLKFSVTSNPAPTEEWTPYSHIDPPHLHGFLVSEGGQFLLTPVADGGTRVEGATWYRHELWPVGYWRMWSNAIIHRIHLRVLRHIRDEAERTANRSGAWFRGTDRLFSYKVAAPKRSRPCPISAIPVREWTDFDAIAGGIPLSSMCCDE
jgi:hypothetical protein